MTPQEQQMIDGLISRIRNTPVQNKDTEAEQHIQQSLSGAPDAVYVLVQTVLVQQYGLQQAQSQINELKQQNGTLQDQLQQAADHARSTGGSFLSHIFGSGSSQSSQSQQGSQNPPYQPVNSPNQGYPGGYAPPPPPPPVYATQAYPAPGGGGMFGGGGGFLQGAMQTAAGVAAGEMVFQGMEDLFHGFGGHGGGYDRGFGGGGGGGETIINNNYGDDDRNGGRDRDFSNSGGDDKSFYNASDDASRNDSGNDAQASSDIGNFGGDAFDDSGTNDLSLDDNSSNDASFDDNSGGDDFSSSGDNS